MNVPDGHDQQDRLWLKQFADGGAGANDAAKYFFKRHYRPLVRAMVGKFKLDTALTEELVHEAFIRAFDAAERFEQRSRASTWLYRIAVNRFLDHLRRQNPPVEDDDDLERMPEGSDDAGDMQQCVDEQFEVFAQRFPLHAEALQLVYFDKLSARDAAAVQGRSYDAMRQYLVECRGKFREYVAVCRQYLKP